MLGFCETSAARARLGWTLLSLLCASTSVSAQDSAANPDAGVDSATESPAAPNDAPESNGDVGAEAPASPSVPQPAVETTSEAEVAASVPLQADGSAGPTQAEPTATHASEVAPVEPAPIDDSAIQVTVVGTPLARTPGSAHVIRSRQMERFEYDDPHAVLQSVPGVYVRGEDGFGLRPNVGIRGVDPDRSAKITLMEDGVLFGPAPYAAPAAYYFPLITRMTQVRVIKGPGATSFGPQTIGGAIDLITRPIPASLSGGADLTLGSYWHRKAHVHLGTSDGRVGFLIEGLHLANDGFKELPSGDNTGFYRNDWMIKGSYNLDESGAITHELRLKLSYSDELSNETYLGISDADFNRNPLMRYAATALDQMRNHRTAIVATHVYEPSESISLTTNVYRHDYARTWRKVNRFGAQNITLFDVFATDGADSDTYRSLLTGEQDSMGLAQQLWIGPNEREFVSQGIESRLRWGVSTGPLAHQVEAAVRFHNDSINRRHSESPFDLVGGVPFPAGTDRTNSTLVTVVNQGTAHALAVNASDAVTWQSLTITPGVRVEIMRLSLEDRLNAKEHARWLGVVIPGIGAYYGITEELGVLGGVYRGFSAPAPAFPDAATGAEAEPELAVNYELGARYTRGSSRAELIGFYNDYSNMNGNCTLSMSCPDELLDTQVNAGRARIFGLEALVEHEVKLDAFKLPLSLSYTLLQTEFLRSFSSRNPAWAEVEAGDEIPYVPQHQLAATAGIEHKLAGANVSLQYMAAMREQAGTEPLSQVLSTDAQVTLDVSAFYQLMERVRVYANVRNLFDSMYVVSHRPFGARPNAPRMIQVGAKVDL